MHENVFEYLKCLKQSLHLKNITINNIFELELYLIFFPETWIFRICIVINPLSM